MSEVKAVVFDCFGVLAPDMWQAFLDGLPPTADREKARLIRREYDIGRITNAQRYEQLYEATGQHFIDAENAGSSPTKNQRLLEYIKLLREKGLKTSILSNAGSNWLRDSFLTEEEQKLFDDYVLSYEIGIIKPDPKIYLLAAKRLNLEPTEVLMVDDKPLFCEAAEKLGMKAVVYQDFHQFHQDIEKLLKL